jgi:mRNA interferase HigB
MRVFSKKILREFWLKHEDSEEQLKSWHSEAERSIWKSPNEIKIEYPKASIIGDSRVVFNICGNKYRLIVKINYARHWIFIKFLGTHSEYDRINAEII